MGLRILLFLLICNISFAQTDSNTTNFDLKIMAPKLDRSLNLTHQARLERKVIDIFTRNGVVNGKGSTFAVYPMLNLIEFGKLEGISTEQTVKLELSLLVKNVFSQEDFTVYSRTINGVGKTQDAAVTKAINGIRTSGKNYATFIEGMQDKIDNYYEEACDNITTQVNKAIEQADYQQAISMLYVLPTNSDCRKTNQSLLDKAYNEYQAQHCQELIQKADVAILKKDYKDAINILGQVDPGSPCKTDAKNLLQTVQQKVDEQTKRKMDFLNKVYDDNVEIEKVRQKSMKSISNTYIEGINKE